MSGPFDRLLVGRTLAGRYEVRDVIGAGGMSVVFAGFDHNLGREVAVKVVSLPAATPEQRAHLRERFRREAGAAASIAHHPNVVQVYDFGTDAELDLDFLVMECLHGRDLKEALAAAPLSRTEALRVLREAARGVAAGHRAGLVHRDVKPANVFLVGDGATIEGVRVLDYGIAKPLDGDDSLTVGGQLPHSPAYAAPEQTDPAAPVGPATDVYQLGLIGYELLAGTRPWTPEERRRIAAGERIPLPDTPAWHAAAPAVRAVIERALQPSPDQRFPDAAAFAEALSAALEADDDRTVLHAAPPPPPVSSLASAPVPPHVSAPVSPPHGGIAVTPHPVRSALEGGRKRMAPIGIAVAMVLAVAIWLALRGGSAGESEAVAAASDTGAATFTSDSSVLAGLDAEFLRLEAQAAEAESAAATPPDTTAAASRDERSESEAAADVQNVILDLNRSWVDGDLSRHLSHYADRVDYYNRDDASRDVIAEDRGDALRRYPEREMTVLRQAVTFPARNRARVLVDKEWSFEGPDERWDGAERQELILERQDGHWRIVSEKDNEVYRSERSRN